jgi:peptidoglycan hydrolase-like protein with peptidoglycan-binding domain
MSGEPTLEKGVSSEWVVHLQELMREGGFWQGDANGTFDDDLENAVQSLQESLGLSATGVVDDDTWAALEQRTSSAQPTEQQQPAQADGTSADDQASTQASYLSDDGQWQWDGTQWQAVAGQDDSQQTDSQQTDSQQADASNGASADSTPAAAATDTSSYPTLSKGVSSEWVQYLQQVMAHIGYWTGAADGAFTDDLAQAVQKLQGDNGLSPSGVADAQTWELLDTLSRQQSASQDGQQQEQQQGAGRSVAEMSATEKLVEAFNRADINDAVRARILAALSPEALAGAIITFAAVFVASQFTPVGWAEDIALGVTAVFLGTALFRAAEHLIEFAGAANATTDEELTAAGHAFAQACAELEIDALLFLLTKAVGGAGGGPAANVPNSAGMVLATRNGQLVMVAVDSIPVQVAGQWGISAAGAVSTMASTGGGGGGGDDSQPPRELTDDEKWEQAEQARRRQSAGQDPQQGGAVAEVYSTPEAAIGQVEGNVTVIEKVETENAGLRAQGFTKTWYVEGADGQQWTVHFNPRTGQFTGAHLSSSNF